MRFSIVNMERNYALNISSWRYPKPHDIYNMSDNSDTIEELLDGTYFAVMSENGELTGYFCYGSAARVPCRQSEKFYSDESFCDVGLGLKPELCGQGAGVAFVKEVIKFAGRQFDKTRFRLTVASFNARAIKVYKKIGFEFVGSFTRRTDTGKRDFSVMINFVNEDEGRSG